MSLLYKRLGTQTETVFQYYTGVAVQDNAAQQWWYGTLLATNTISNSGKFAKLVHPDFFGENVGRSSHYCNLQNQ